MTTKLLKSAATIAACATLTLLFSGCSVRTPSNLTNVPIGTNGGGASQPGTNSVDPNAQPAGANAVGERYDAEAEEVISRDSLKAWRTAVAHFKNPDKLSDSDWKKQRDADEKSAMEQLEDLRSRYPSSSTVVFMMGQVKEHFGKKSEAIEFYKKSTANNTVNGMTLFKIAENERETGKTKDAVEHYRELLKSMPDFYAGKLGLAKCLVKDKPEEAHQLAQEVLAAEPKDATAMSEAQKIVSETKGGKSDQ